MSKSESSSFEDLADTEPKNEGTPEKDNDDDSDVKHSSWQDVLGSGHILKRVIVESKTDIKPQRGDICKINYEAFLKDGILVDKQDDFELQVGDAEIIQGVDLVLPLMAAGETSMLKISPRFGYGSIGLPPKIPPDTELLYTVELISFEPEPELETLSLEQRHIIGNKKRERGNWWYTMQDPMIAVQCYKRAINYLDEKEGGITDPSEDGEIDFGSEKLHAILDDRMKAYNNMAAAQIKMGAFGPALSSVETVLTCQPNNVKALFRKGKILAYKNDTNEAIKFVKKALALSPDDKAIKAELSRLDEREKKDNKKEKDLARKMFGDSFGSKSKPDGDKTKKSRNKWVFVWGVVFSVAVGAVSVALYKYKIM